MWELKTNIEELSNNKELNGGWYLLCQTNNDLYDTIIEFLETYNSDAPKFQIEKNQKEEIQITFRLQNEIRKKTVVFKFYLFLKPLKLTTDNFHLRLQQSIQDLWIQNKQLTKQVDLL